MEIDIELREAYGENAGFLCIIRSSTGSYVVRSGAVHQTHKKFEKFS